jgi:hypothetical protein
MIFITLHSFELRFDGERLKSDHSMPKIEAAVYLMRSILCGNRENNNKRLFIRAINLILFKRRTPQNVPASQEYVI